MRPQLFILAIPVVALVATVWLPFVNTSTLWLGLPSVMVWTAAWVLAITPALALFEFSARQREKDRVDAAGGEHR
jgi:membrane protein YdbS with pleckstrin-like domain